MDAKAPATEASRPFPDSYYEHPTFFEFFERLAIAMNEFGCNSTKYPHDYQFTWRMITSVRLVDVATVLGLAVLLTLVRVLLTKFVSLPLADKLQLKPNNRSKWPESVFKFIYYIAVWLYCLQVVICSGKYNFFYRPLDIFKEIVFADGYLDRPVPTDIYWIYMVQLAFYAHSVYGTLHMDVWRKDSVVMLFHHCVTIFLLEFSFLMKYHKVGALVLLIHDIGDVILEFTKLNIYLKDRANKNWPLNEWCANIGFLTFTISWAWLRLYWFPLKILYTCHWGVYLYHKDKDPKMFMFFNLLLYALQFLHVYWFYFMLLLIARVASGKSREMEDTRDFEETGQNGVASGEAVDGSQEVGDGSQEAAEQNGVRQRAAKRQAAE